MSQIYTKTLPTPGDVHVNTPLTNISIAFMQSMSTFVADRVFPNIPVSMQSDRYYTYDRTFFNRDDMQVRAPGAESKGTEYSVDNTPTYYAPVYALHHDIPDQRRANSDSVLQPDREATELLTQKAMIKRETLWVSKYFTAGIWSNELEGVSATPGAGQVLQWNDPTSTPIEDVRAAMTTQQELTAFRPNVMVVNRQVFDALIDHPDIVDRIKYGQTAPGPAVADAAELAAIFKIERVLIMDAIQNLGAEGAAENNAFIGGKSALLAYAAPNPGLMVPTAGYTFSWTGFLGAAAQGQRIRRFRMEGISSDRVEIEMAFDQKLVSADLGFFFETIVA